MVDAAILFRQPNNRAQAMRWLHHEMTAATTLTVNPASGDLAIDGGNLRLSGAGVQQVSGVSATDIQAHNLRGIDVKVTRGSKGMVITYLQPEADAHYSMTVQPSWMTMACVTRKGKDGFTVQFSVPAPDGGTIDWQLIR